MLLLSWENSVSELRYLLAPEGNLGGHLGDQLDGLGLFRPLPKQTGAPISYSCVCGGFRDARPYGRRDSLLDGRKCLRCTQIIKDFARTHPPYT